MVSACPWGDDVFFFQVYAVLPGQRWYVVLWYWPGFWWIRRGFERYGRFFWWYWRDGWWCAAGWHWHGCWWQLTAYIFRRGSAGLAVAPDHNLVSAVGSDFPSEVRHLLDYLQARLQEPATLKGAHQATRFFEEITAIPERERLTDSTVYVLAKKEILAAALPGGGFPKQAPRFPTVVFGSS